MKKAKAKKAKLLTTQGNLPELSKQIQNEFLDLPQLKLLHKNLVKKYLEFFFCKTNVQQIKEVCQKKFLGDKGRMDIIELAIGESLDDVFKMDDDGKLIALEIQL